MTTFKEYNHDTTATEAARSFSSNIHNKTILITGCSPKTIGDATAHALASADPKLLIISGRSSSKLDESEHELHKAHPSLQVRKLIMDLSSQKSVRKAAEEVNAYPEDIDVLINNAGLMGLSERQLSEDGIEMQFGCNHVGHFLFTNLILPKLIAAASASSSNPGSVRIINVSSRGHMYSPVRFSDYNCDHSSQVPSDEEPDWERLKWRGEKVDRNGYGRMIAYGQSKTANILFSVYLKERLLGKSGIQSFSLHPGGVLSAGGMPMLKELDPKVLKTLKSIDQGASTTIVAAFDPALGEEKGVYLDDCQMAEVARDWATKPEFAERLWRLSEKLVGEEFTL